MEPSSSNKTSNQRDEILAQERALRDGDPDLEQEAMLESVEIEKELERDEKKIGNPFRFVPLKMGDNGRIHTVSAASAALMEEVTLDDLEKMTCLFYDKAFQDKTLEKFIRSQTDPHASRLAKWIHQKISGSTIWDEDRRTRVLHPVELFEGYRHVVHDRTSAHVAAWYSPKRPETEFGRHFQLDECRVWMRLHFWAMRESGIIAISPSFTDYYVRFIAHFVNIYERTAPAFTRDSFRWSEDVENIKTYIDNGRVMTDILGLTPEEAEAQIPRTEANDKNWPYTTEP